LEKTNEKINTTLKVVKYFVVILVCCNRTFVYFIYEDERILYTRAKTDFIGKFTEKKKTYK